MLFSAKLDSFIGIRKLLGTYHYTDIIYLCTEKHPSHPSHLSRGQYSSVIDGREGCVRDVRDKAKMTRFWNRLRVKTDKVLLLQYRIRRSPTVMILRRLDDDFAMIGY